MSGILIYPEKEALRNSFSIKKFTSLLDVKYVGEDYRGPADFVINRTNNWETADYYEKKGIRVFNPSLLSKIANDKQRCYDFMQKNGIEIMPVRYDGVPAVRKKIDGHGGTEVQMITKSEEQKDGYVYQKPCDTPGKDLRVWLIGGEIVTAILRENKNDFRSNYCLGGTATPYRLGKDEARLVESISSLIKSDYIGIDFLFHQGRLVFNEIEDTVGARMVYDKTDIDIIAMYCRYIKSVL